MVFVHSVCVARSKLIIGSFSFVVDNPLWWVAVVCIALFFLYHWGLKNFVVFCCIVAACIFLMQRLDTFVFDIFGRQEGELYVLLTRPFFVFIIGFVFIYYTFVHKD